jgi:hypothetical protein
MKIYSLFIVLALFFLALPNESLACHKGTPHGPHVCDGEPPPDPDPEPSLLTPCDVDLCIASIGKWHPPPAREYTEQPGVNGSYTEISHGDFGNILASLPADDFGDLCLAFDVLVFEWNTPNIKNLSWSSLVEYMKCDGGIIFEDPTNVDVLTDGVETTAILVHDKSGAYPEAAFVPACVNSALTICGAVTYPSSVWDDPFFEFPIYNNHMVFAEAQPSLNPSLTPFLRTPSADGTSGEVLGLYGQYMDGSTGRGRIVLTGPDNNFHGSLSLEPTNPDRFTIFNQYEVLFNEIDWLLGL